jgi:Phytoene/squalene synthetase
MENERLSSQISNLKSMIERIIPESCKSRSDWSEERWNHLERETLGLTLQAKTEEAAWEIITRQARTVLRAYSTSFFVVTRFLPAHKRAKVEAIYAAVRYPDEIVDTFPIDRSEQSRRLDAWAAQYEAALACSSIMSSIESGTPCFLASFAAVVRDAKIPPEHYRAFIEAMRLDASPRLFMTLDDLIESYVYGSAIVVGYFLTHVYGSSSPQLFTRALESARSLGIALQLTNFLRDVGEDQRRGRVYLPLDHLRAEEIEEVNVRDARGRNALNRVLRRLAAISENYYTDALGGLSAFAPDSQTAIRACIDVYRQLNNRIGRSPQGVLHRESVPFSEKLKVLPASKYWRLPLAYLNSGEWFAGRRQSQE